MQIPEKDISYIIDVYNYCLIAREFVKSVKFHHFSLNKEKIFAVERAVEIIGEASNKISKETKLLLPNIPWRKIIGMRNRLVHEYGEIKIEKLWYIVEDEIPILIEKIKEIEEINKYL